ncbi:MAG: hypothetical protein K1X67_20965 [Fimbriimonadaceae bacterium]|nr:hypothetical protein [Fimbriimonadaceae bacterium]
MPSRSLDDALNAIRNEHIRGKACVGKKFEEELSESEKVLLRKSPHFADPITGYSDAELEALLNACRERSYAIGIDVVRKLLSFPKKERKAVQRVIVKGRMSSRQVQALIKSKHGGPRRTNVGRKPIDLTSTDAALKGLRDLSSRYLAAIRLLHLAHVKKELTLPKKLPKSLALAESHCKELLSLIEQC